VRLNRSVFYTARDDVHKNPTTLHLGVDQRFETENYTPATVAHVQDVPPGRDQTVRGRAAFRQAVFRGKPPAVICLFILNTFTLTFDTPSSRLCDCESEISINKSQK